MVLTSLQKCSLIEEAVSFFTSKQITKMKTFATTDWNLQVWDTLILDDKPPKELFEAKLQELIDAQPFEQIRTKRNTLLSQTDKYATVDYPHASDVDKQKWIDYRQALRDLPAVVTPTSSGHVKIWITNDNGALQAGDPIDANFTKGEPAIAKVLERCDFTGSYTDTYYSTFVSVSNVTTVSNVSIAEYSILDANAQSTYAECNYYSSNSISHYEGEVITHYSNVVAYDGINVYTNVEVGEYSNLTTDEQTNYAPITTIRRVYEETEGYEPVLVYSNVSEEVYSNLTTEQQENYQKVITHYSNVAIEKVYAHSNITSSEYERLDSNLVVTPGYTYFSNATSNITVQEYAQLTPTQRSEYTIHVVEPVTSNLQANYKAFQRVTPQDIKYIDATGAETDEANAVRIACHVACEI